LNDKLLKDRRRHAPAIDTPPRFRKSRNIRPPERLFALQDSQGHIRLENRRVVPARARGHNLF
jgi:hypothetical protein